MGEVRREYAFDLPVPPSVNRYYRHVGYRVLISREGRRYRMMCVSRLAGSVEKFTGPVRFSVDVYPPDRRRRDLDNLLKSLQDAIVHAGVMADDSLIKSLHMEMRDPVPPEGFVHVHIETLPAERG